MTKSAIKGVNFERVMVMVLLFQEDPCAPVLYQVKILKDRGTEKSKITRKEESRVHIKVGSHDLRHNLQTFRIRPSIFLAKHLTIDLSKRKTTLTVRVPFPVHTCMELPFSPPHLSLPCRMSPLGAICSAPSLSIQIPKLQTRGTIRP